MSDLLPRRSFPSGQSGLERALTGRGAWLWLILAAALGTGLLFTGLRWLVPLGQALLAWPILWVDLRAGRLGRAAGHMLLWAGLLSLGTIECSIHFPRMAEMSILRGAAYREEMFTWIRTGVGTEGDFSRFLPQHLLHYGLTLLLSLATAGLAGLVLGAVLLNYMNFYVGALVQTGTDPILGSLFGWPVWSLVRVVAFVLGAIAAAHLGAARFTRWIPRKPVEARRLFLWSLGLFLADLALKATLAPFWRGMLARALLP